MLLQLAGPVEEAHAVITRSLLIFRTPLSPYARMSGSDRYFQGVDKKI
jgi:hypothetical protein